jgi:hypothetical protein
VIVRDVPITTPWEALERAAETNHEIGSFVRAVQRTPDDDFTIHSEWSRRLEGLPFADIQRIIRERGSRANERDIQLTRWGETASQAEFLDAARNLPTTLEDPPGVGCYLAIFRIWTLYERNPCSECREAIITALIDLAVLPDWMAHECLLDANLNIRSRVRRNLDT